MFHRRGPIRPRHRHPLTKRPSLSSAPQRQSLRWRDQESLSSRSSVSKLLHPGTFSTAAHPSLFNLMFGWCVVDVLFSRISGAEVEMRVRPGDDVTLYCDCVWKSGFRTLWFRNCSHDHQPPLIISTSDFIQGAFPRYTAVLKSSNQIHDLLVKNVSESDLGLYYCALWEKKITEDQTGGYVQKHVYHYGNRTTRLALLGSKERREPLTGNVFQVGCVEEHHCKRSMNGESCSHTEVCYTSLK
ncbi:hypothetical protein MHYP_G00250330 [Metynnis hypsauchen]